MSKHQKLSEDDREFFQWVSEATFNNPFTDKRRDLDFKMLKMPPNADLPVFTRVDRLMAEVSSRIQRLESEGKGTLDSYTGEERAIMQVALLFDDYHKSIADFDQLIRDQLKANATSVRVRFASKILDSMARRNLPVDKRLHYFAVFYQLRRAYYFIDRGLTGKCPCMKEFRSRLWNNVFTADLRRYGDLLWNHMEDFSTLLLGETGTGKGAAAEAIGQSGYIPFDKDKGCFSESFTENFVSINLSQFPEGLIESELFGHKKGSFTNAVDDHKGQFARCQKHGSVFLDEIGDVAEHIQVKLLQILQERKFSQVGSHIRHNFYGRVIAATNRPLGALRRSGKFRNDFFYRLCSDVIQVPPLRQRLKEDPSELNVLLAPLVTRLTGTESQELTDDIRRSLAKNPGRSYSWPGNVRELEQAVRRVILTGRYDGDDATVSIDPQDSFVTRINEGAFTADALMATYCAQLYQRYGSYEEVARRTQLDRRTAKKHLKIGLQFVNKGTSIGDGRDATPALRMTDDSE